MGLEHGNSKRRGAAGEALGKKATERMGPAWGRKEGLKGDQGTLVLITFHPFSSVVPFDPYHNSGK